MTERRYDDDEVREIFSLATTSDTRDQLLQAETGGLTLEELKRIGQEAGIEPSRVAQAVERLDSRGRVAPVRRSLGIPVGVARVVELPRAPTDREWEGLISEFRTTFGAQGTTTISGGHRDWSHGNLHISIEPTQYGQQLRLSTLKDDAIALNLVGVVTGGMSVIMSAAVAASGKPDKALVILGMFGGLSLFSFGANLIRMPRWRKEREAQMEHVAQLVVKLLSDS
jgi:hypothetical protein